MNNTPIVYTAIAIVLSALITFTTTPAVSVLAWKIGAVDVPKDERRMHNHPIPQIGGLAIFFGFVTATLIFGEISPSMIAMWIGGAVIVLTGMIDDIRPLNPFAKLAGEIIAAGIAVWQGYTIEYIQLFGVYIHFGFFTIPFTVLWIVGLTNAINLIDGLDGLSSGVSAICSATLLLITMMKGDYACAMIAAAIVGACLGFLPFNRNPAKIFMGDTGALFLGYTLSLLSIRGLFKFHTVMSFIIPLSIFGLPLFDTVFAFFRRILHGKSPFSSDKSHIHHRLIAMGFNQKESVRIIYAVCGILGVSALLLTFESTIRSLIVIFIAFAIFIVNFLLMKNEKTRARLGIGSMATETGKEKKTENKDS